MRRWLIGIVGLAVVGCASMTPTVTKQEAYAIYDIKGGAGSAGAIGDGITQALQKNMTGVRVNKEIPPSPLPAKPQRFLLTDLFKNSGLAVVAGVSYKVPSCPGAMLTTAASNEAMAKYGENTTFFVCVQPYTEGYWMTVYSTFSKRSGATSPAMVGAELARAFVGDSSQFIPRTVNDLVAAAKATGASVSVVEAYP